MSRLTIDDVYEHVHGVCFRTGPPGRVGAETEWLVLDRRRPGEHVLIDRLRAVMAAADPLPAGSRITYEPGGQLELSTLPSEGIQESYTALLADVRHVRRHLAGANLSLSGLGVDPVRPPLLQLHTPRYQCMSGYFGVSGLQMMCSTASLQVCLDIGADTAEAARRWRLAHALRPILVAAFANSPLRAGQRTGWRSTRQDIWDALDHGRTRPPPPGDPVETWARYALAARVMALPDGKSWVIDPGMTFHEWVEGDTDYRCPTEADLDYHLSTLFPPVRPRGWFELRMIDAPPEPYWPVPIAVTTALFDDATAADAAACAAEPVAGHWREAARDALTDPALADAARACFAAARAALPRLGAGTALLSLVDEYAERYVERGRCPADEVAAAHPPHAPAGTRAPART